MISLLSVCDHSSYNGINSCRRMRAAKSSPALYLNDSPFFASYLKELTGIGSVGVLF